MLATLLALNQDPAIQVVSNLKDVSAQTTSYFSHLNFQAASWDLFVVLFIALSTILYGWLIARDKIVAIFVSLYAAESLSWVISGWQSQFQNTPYEIIFKTRGAMVAVLFVVFFFLLARSAVFASSSRAASGKLWQALILSFLQAVLLACLILSGLPEEFTNNFSGYIKMVLLSSEAKLVWLLSPVVIFALIRKRSFKKREQPDYFDE